MTIGAEKTERRTNSSEQKGRRRVEISDFASFFYGVNGLRSNICLERNRTCRPIKQANYLVTCLKCVTFVC